MGARHESLEVRGRRKNCTRPNEWMESISLNTSCVIRYTMKNAVNLYLIQFDMAVESDIG